MYILNAPWQFQAAAIGSLYLMTMDTGAANTNPIGTVPVGLATLAGTP